MSRNYAGYLTLFLFSFFALAPSFAKADADTCEFILSTYLEAHLGDRDFRAIDEVYNQATDIVHHLTAPLSEFDPYTPLFRPRGVLFTALRDEFRALGYSSTREITEAVTLFTKTQDSQRLLEITNQATLRVLSRVGNIKVSTDAQSLKSLLTRSADLQISASQLVDLLTLLQQDGKEGFPVLRIAILHQLVNLAKVAPEQLPKIGLFERMKTQPPLSVLKNVFIQPEEVGHGPAIQKTVKLKLRHLELLAQAEDPKFQSAYNRYLDDFVGPARPFFPYLYTIASEERGLATATLIKLTSYLKSESDSKTSLGLIFEYIKSSNLFHPSIHSSLLSLANLYHSEDSSRATLVQNILSEFDRLHRFRNAKNELEESFETLHYSQYEGFRNQSPAFFENLVNKIGTEYIEALGEKEFLRYLDQFIYQVLKISEPSFSRLFGQIKKSLMNSPLLLAEFRSALTKSYENVSDDKRFFIARELQGLAGEKEKHFAFIAKGAFIRTWNGNGRVENLQPGDYVLTYNGVAKRTSWSKLISVERWVAPISTLISSTSRINLARNFYSINSYSSAIKQSINQASPSDTLIVNRYDGSGPTKTSYAKVEHPSLDDPSSYSEVFHLNLEGLPAYFANDLLIEERVQKSPL